MEYETTLHRKVATALGTFFRRDRGLLEINVNERSITHKFAEHLQRQFKGLDVDCEYNRHGEAKKVLPCYPEHAETDHLDGKTVFPDIIVHRRTVDSYNRLVIEIKKSSASSIEHDKMKLRAFTRPDQQYRYELGLLLVFDVQGKRIFSAECFRQGKKEECEFCKNLKGLGG